jgi:predicted outer membrane repeat protein
MKAVRYFGFRVLFVLTAVLLGVVSVGYGRVIYVDDDANGLNDGSSWTNSYRYLQDALADANSIEKPVEIRVAQGIYRPDRRSAEPNGTGDRIASFELTSGITLKGGFAGFGMPDPNTRDIALYKTILSGDLAGNDIEVNDPRNLLDEPTRIGNAWGVVVCYQADNTAVLDGLTITAGRCSVISEFRPVGGGGMIVSDSNPVVINCTFIGNAATQGGGAVCNIMESDPTFINCTFAKNYAGNGGAIAGGGLNTVITDCTFIGNAGYGGGALSECPGIISNCLFRGNSAHRGGALNGCNGLITNCFFSGNSASEHGGVIDAGYRDSPTFENCIFANNVAAGIGGGLFIYYETNATLINCSFSANSATNGNALAIYTWSPEHPPSNVRLTNCILWDRGKEIWKNDTSIISVNYSDVYGGYGGIDNIDVDPLFADPNNGDYHLKSQAGRWDPKTQRWVKNDVTSPCIDAGDPMSPIGEEPFPNGGRINMGAYGGTAEASKSYFGNAPCETIVAGDINGDCKVDFIDLVILARHWLEEG